MKFSLPRKDFPILLDSLKYFIVKVIDIDDWRYNNQNLGM